MRAWGDLKYSCHFHTRHMSTYLWKYYFDDDIQNFQRLLANATYNASAFFRGGQGGRGINGGALTSQGASLATSPNLTSKIRKSHGLNSPGGSSWTVISKPSANLTLTRADLNWKDSHGITLLHHLAASQHENALQFGLALLQAPFIDLYIQDTESGWTALHRALYFGNIRLARALINRDLHDAAGPSNVGIFHQTSGLIKIKDWEGNSPFDVYGASIVDRAIRQASAIPLLSGTSDDEENEMPHGVTGDDDVTSTAEVAPRVNIQGDETFTFGSNKNFTLGFGNEDDRQYPERIILERPEYLIQRFFAENQAKSLEPVHIDSPLYPGNSRPLNEVPALIRHRPIVIQDIQLSKLHSAILTTDPEANLYVCGFGPGGRLGTGDEITRFHFVGIGGGGLMRKKIIDIGLGQNHTIAISSQGEVFTWGSNAFGQLGHSVASSSLGDEEPVQLLPRQVFGPLKREIVVGAAASRIHTVVQTASSLYTFGKNDGQLGLVDSDARSLIVQHIPRKIAASLFFAPIKSISAIDRATICLLENHDVWVFANYGYTKLAFPNESPFNEFPSWDSSIMRRKNPEDRIRKVTSGGDTICAVSSMGDVFTINVSRKAQPDSGVTSSTTNPSKIRSALSNPLKVWSARKDHMAVRDVAVGQDDSIIICTDSGSVWRRIRRAKVKNANSPGSAEYKPKDYKFSRVGGLTRVTAVRSSAFGAYAAVRKDCNVCQTQIEVDNKRIWKDLHPLLAFRRLEVEEDSDTEMPAPRFWRPSTPADCTATIRRAVLSDTKLEERLVTLLKDEDASERSTYDLRMKTTSSDMIIPAHEFVVTGRSDILRQALSRFRQIYYFSIPDIMTIEYDHDGRILISFPNADFITILNLVLYMYTDSVIDVWRHTKRSPELGFRYRQIRLELMKVASHLGLPGLEQAARLMVEPSKILDQDMRQAIRQAGYFQTGDIEIRLSGSSVRVHSALMCQRCPFFEGLFHGRAGGLWLSSRREKNQELAERITVDLEHVELDTFRLILQHLYADMDDEIFDNVVTENCDAFLDLVIDVMSVANELMLDRLQQCCQMMLGRFGVLHFGE